jgi:benzoyl-CoA-dihydrodiol lyase
VERTLKAPIGIAYKYVNVAIDRAKRVGHLHRESPERPAQPTDIAAIEAAGAAWYPLQMAREFDDAILNMRTNELDIGAWVLKTRRRCRRRAGIRRR